MGRPTLHLLCGKIASGKSTLARELAAGSETLLVSEDAFMAPSRAATPAQKVDPANPETWGRVSRNQACPCGSGKKYRHCHGAVGEASA